MSNIHPLAFVSPEAQLGENVEIGPYAYIDKDVVIGPDARLIGTPDAQLVVRKGSIIE